MDRQQLDEMRRRADTTLQLKSIASSLDEIATALAVICEIFFELTASNDGRRYICTGDIRED